jgi:hypothetical protein
MPDPQLPSGSQSRPLPDQPASEQLPPPALTTGTGDQPQQEDPTQRQDQQLDLRKFHNMLNTSNKHFYHRNRLLDTSEQQEQHVTFAEPGERAQNIEPRPTTEAATVAETPHLQHQCNLRQWNKNNCHSCQLKGRTKP